MDEHLNARPHFPILFPHCSQTQKNPTTYGKAGSWGKFIHDNQWHFKCINVQKEHAKYGIVGNGWIYSIIWHNGGGQYPRDASNQWWLDDFSIGNQPLHLKLPTYIPPVELRPQILFPNATANPPVVTPTLFKQPEVNIAQLIKDGAKVYDYDSMELDTSDKDLWASRNSWPSGIRDCTTSYRGDCSSRHVNAPYSINFQGVLNSEAQEIQSHNQTINEGGPPIVTHFDNGHIKVQIEDLNGKIGLNSTHPCNATHPCETCQGHCTLDEDCKGKLVCYHRELGPSDVVPGCSTNGMKPSHNYCMQLAPTYYDANKYPYMCMAYKMPEDTVVNMLAYIGNVGWRSITMTQTKHPTGYKAAGDWGTMITDNEWHYTCINFNEQRKKASAIGNNKIYHLIFYPGGGAPYTGDRDCIKRCGGPVIAADGAVYNHSAYSEEQQECRKLCGYWWLDDFSISDVDFLRPPYIPGHRVDNQLSVTVQQMDSLCLMNGQLWGSYGHLYNHNWLFQIPPECRWSQRLGTMRQYYSAAGSHGARIDIRYDGWAKVVREYSHPSGNTPYNNKIQDRNPSQWISLNQIIISTSAGTEVDYLNNFQRAGDTYGIPTWRRNGKLCVLTGLIEDSTATWSGDGAMFVLPKACRPESDITVVTQKDENSGGLIIKSNGKVYIDHISSHEKHTYGLNGINFLVKDDVELNTFGPGWGPSSSTEETMAKWRKPMWSREQTLCAVGGRIYFEHDRVAAPAIETVPKDCNDVFNVLKHSNALTPNGLYTIDPDGLGEFKVFCDFNSEADGPLLVFQRRNDGASHKGIVPFNRNWIDYKLGFPRPGDYYILTGINPISKTTPTWQQNYDVCTAEGKTMCTAAEVCSNGTNGAPRNGTRTGNIWIPVLDGDSTTTWLSIGTTSTCTTKTNSATHKYAEVMCCDHSNGVEAEKNIQNGGAFWLGLDKIHRLTKKDERKTILRVKIKTSTKPNIIDGSLSGFALYDNFKVEDEASKYRLNMGGYDSSSTAGNGLGTYMSRSRFSTRDEDNDNNGGQCSGNGGAGGWWFNSCHHGSLNGEYGRSNSNGPAWRYWNWRAPSHWLLDYDVQITMNIQYYSHYSKTRLLATLPKACRPAQRAIFSVRQGVDVRENRPRVDVFPDGRIMLMSGAPWYNKPSPVKSADSCGNLHLTKRTFLEPKGLVTISDLGMGVCNSTEPCTKCQGDCDTDDDCQGNLICHQREVIGDVVPGCHTKGMTHTENNQHDYCTSREIQWKENGWPTTTAVCSESELSSEDEHGICVKDKTWKESKETCTMNGMRLCTMSEIRNQETKNSGCDFEDSKIWSSTGRCFFFCVVLYGLPPQSFCI